MLMCCRVVVLGTHQHISTTTRQHMKKAKPHHIPAIEALFQACIAAMDAKGIRQWNKDYPGRENIIKDIERQELYCIGEGEEVQGVITLNDIQDPQYKDINWKYEGKILVVHRLAAHPAYQGKGIGVRLMQFAEDYGAENGYDAIRLDGYEGNPRSMAFYRKLGYMETGFVQFDYQSMRCVCFEKKINNA